MYVWFKSWENVCILKKYSNELITCFFWNRLIRYISYACSTFNAKSFKLLRIKKILFLSNSRINTLSTTRILYTPVVYWKIVKDLIFLATYKSVMEVPPLASSSAPEQVSRKSLCHHVKWFTAVNNLIAAWLSEHTISIHICILEWSKNIFPI